MSPFIVVYTLSLSIILLPHPSSKAGPQCAVCRPAIHTNVTPKRNLMSTIDWLTSNKKGKIIHDKYLSLFFFPVKM